MKKVYMKPAMRVMQLQYRTSLLQSSVRGLSTNLTGGDAIGYGGGGSGSARVKENPYDVWDDDWSK